MAKDHYNDLLAFVSVASELSFTKAAAKMSISPSALSHTIRNLEFRLGMRLFTRTTRAVTLTEAGQHLLTGVSPHLEAIDQQIDALNTLRDRPVGTIRLSAPDLALKFYLWPKMREFIARFPEVILEISVNNGFIDIVSENFDAGIRMGENLAKDMISAKISPDIRFLVVGAASYISDKQAPVHPRDLAQYSCINYRFSASGPILPWEFAKDGKIIKVRVNGPLIFNNIENAVEAALAGMGLAYIHEEYAAPYINDGRLFEWLSDWSPYSDGLHLYYPNRNHTSSALSALARTLRLDENKG
ncbi:LysR family transcriptional regulator [Kluyvera intermedia]|uniref:LysR family transcriptional regulator n=1 Tax=Kluyvera intermedia TaxID=61648 RepID=UPI0024313761|nr:LysR family transcriptional regulator [Kluyvera intermedia]WEJ85040.1 MAG: LysR family transcriptional regulator [Kluyvera intermedia]